MTADEAHELAIYRERARVAETRLGEIHRLLYKALTSTERTCEMLRDEGMRRDDDRVQVMMPRPRPPLAEAPMVALATVADVRGARSAALDALDVLETAAAKALALTKTQ